MAKDAKTIREELARPFAPEDLEWRIQVTTKDKTSGLAIPYVTNRAIQDRLDEVVGPENWYNDYKPWHGNGKKDAQICGISIYFEGKGFNMLRNHSTIRIPVPINHKSPCHVLFYNDSASSASIRSSFCSQSVRYNGHAVASMKASSLPD